MKLLKARARAEEAVHANRTTNEFLAQAAGLKALGEWAAKEMMGEGAPGVAAYAEALVRSKVAGSDAFKSVCDDLRLAGNDQPTRAIRTRFEQYLDQARSANTA